MELSEEQKTLVTEWVAAGDGLADIQRKLLAECEIKATYMDVRFLILDLGLDLKDKEVKRPATPVADDTEAATAPPAAGVPPAGPQEHALGAGVTVEVDRLMKPGALVSGNVTFSDGVTATWMLDQLGRLALDAGQPDYKPSDADLQAFQDELRAALQKQGY